MPRAGDTLITESLIAEAGRLAATCEYMETIAAALGISKPTLYDWVKRGVREQRRIDKGLKPQAGAEPHRAIANAIKKGRAESEQRSLAVIDAAAQAGAWQAAAWRLERAHPERWSLQKSELARLRKIVKKLAEKQGIDAETLETKTDE